MICPRYITVYSKCHGNLNLCPYVDCRNIYIVNFSSFEYLIFKGSLKVLLKAYSSMKIKYWKLIGKISKIFGKYRQNLYIYTHTYIYTHRLFFDLLDSLKLNGLVLFHKMKVTKQTPLGNLMIVLNLM